MCSRPRWREARLGLRRGIDFLGRDRFRFGGQATRDRRGVAQTALVDDGEEIGPGQARRTFEDRLRDLDEVAREPADHGGRGGRVTCELLEPLASRSARVR